ncbi:MAG TPA: hypothetical protein VM888_09755 [Chitinophagaceae bacterium]|nr:hypothetical protein [Chitinophagaceae bacterium]
MRKHIDKLYFLSAFLFAVAATLSFINNNLFKGGLCIAAFIAMFLAGFNHRKNNKI